MGSIGLIYTCGRKQAPVKKRCKDRASRAEQRRSPTSRMSDGDVKNEPSPSNQRQLKIVR
jgi:hypothetical protein